MKAGILNSPDTAPFYGEFTDPEPSIGLELVTMVAAGIHPVVRSLASGKHYASKPIWPMIPGIDAVARAADDSLMYTGFINPPYGTFAERLAAPSAMRFALPENADPVQIAAGMNPGLSSWMPLNVRKSEVEGLGTVLILGVTGVAGLLAVQNAFALGAERVIGVGRNEAGLKQASMEKAETVSFSGDRATDAAAIAKALSKTAPTLVLDFVWGAPAEATFDALSLAALESQDKFDTSYVQIGSMAASEASLPAALLRSRRIRISGSGLGSGSMSSILAQLPVYMQLIADGRVKVPTRVFPLSKISDAWASNVSGQRNVLVLDQ